MKTSIAPGLLVVLCALSFIYPVAAQDGADIADKAEKEVQSGESRSLRDILLTEQRQLGFAVMFDEGILTDSNGDPLKITYIPPTGSSSDQRLVGLFEVLRRAGLVMMEVRGLPGLTYQLLELKEAAGYANVVTDVADLKNAYFGTLALEARTISPSELKTLVRQFAGSHAAILDYQPTSRVIVSDFADNLRTIAAAASEAQTRACRTDDIVTEAFRPARHVASGLMYAVEDARQPGETYVLSLHEGSGSLMVSGTRRHVEVALERLKQLDAQPEVESARATLHIDRYHILPPDEVLKALREFFVSDIKHGTFRVTALPRRKQLLFDCSEERYRAAMVLLKEIDRAPRSITEAAAEARNLAEMGRAAGAGPEVEEAPENEDSETADEGR